MDQDSTTPAVPPHPEFVRLWERFLAIVASEVGDSEDIGQPDPEANPLHLVRVEKRQELQDAVADLQAYFAQLPTPTPAHAAQLGQGQASGTAGELAHASDLMSQVHGWLCAVDPSGERETYKARSRWMLKPDVELWMQTFAELLQQQEAAGSAAADAGRRED